MSKVIQVPVGTAKQLVAALNDTAFQVETVAHLRGLERELLPKAELNRALAMVLEKLIKKPVPEDPDWLDDAVTGLEADMDRIRKVNQQKGALPPNPKYKKRKNNDPFGDGLGQLGAHPGE